MKVILFTDSMGAGGAQRQLVGLAVMLKERGYDVKVVTYFDKDFYKQYLEDNRVKNEIIPNADNTKKRIWVVRDYLKKENPDCVIAYQETPSLVASAARLLGCKFKLIVSERNTTQRVGMNERVRFYLYKWADVIVPNSYTQERWMKSHYPRLSDKIQTITNFVDLEMFDYVEHKRNEIPEIVIAATIWSSKNTLGLINAVSLLKSKAIKCHFSWYGIHESHMDYLNKCLSLIDSLDLGEYISLLPKTKDIQSKYREADYFCLPSFFEGTPNVICEAISTGVPVICSDVCDNSIYVKDGVNGILFDPTNSVDIADKLESIMSQSDGDYAAYRKNCRSIAEQLLNKQIFVDKYLKILNE